MAERRAGITFFKIDGAQFPMKGEATYGLGKPERTSIVGQDGVHGFAENPMAPFIELTITDGASVNLDNLSNVTDSTIVLELANGKLVVLRNAFNTNPDGLGGSTSEGEINVRFEGLAAEEIAA